MALLFSFFGLFGNKTSKQDSATLKPGQVWKYDTLQGNEESRLIILKLEDYGQKGLYAHIAITQLQVNNESSMTGISHLPFTQEAVIQSVTELEGTIDPLPEFMEGYLMWKEAFDKEEGGVFTAEVKEVIKILMNNMYPPES